MSGENTRNQAVQRALALVEILVCYAVSGITHRELMALAGYESKALLSHDLNTLAAVGWAEKQPDGKWRITDKPLGLFVLFSRHITEQQERVAALMDRVTLQANKHTIS